MHKILHVYIEIFSNSYKHHITNNFEQLIEKKGLEIISIITTPILTIISMHIGPTRFLKAGVPEVVFNTDKKILKELVIVEEICAKLIFS